MIAERVRDLLARKRWTAQQLVDALGEVGVEWTRLIVANLLVKKSDRRRRYVTVDELLALAYVLDVAPIHLLVPIDNEARWYAVTPKVLHPAGLVRNWIRGRIPMPGRDRRVYFSEVPENEWRVPEDALRRLAEGNPAGADEVETDLPKEGPARG